jgi:hypothetical protein
VSWIAPALVVVVEVTEHRDAAWIRDDDDDDANDDDDDPYGGFVTIP